MPLNVVASESVYDIAAVLLLIIINFVVRHGWGWTKV